MAEDCPYTDAELEATMIIARHGRTRIEGCACGWGMDGSKLGQSHALHVWRELQRAVLPGHDAELERRVRADERTRVAEEIAQAAEAYALRLHGTAAAVLRAGAHHAAAMLRQHATPPTTEGDHHG